MYDNCGFRHTADMQKNDTYRLLVGPMVRLFFNKWFFDFVVYYTYHWYDAYGHYDYDDTYTYTYK